MQQIIEDVQSLIDTDTYLAYLRGYGEEVIGTKTETWQLCLDPYTGNAYIEFPYNVIHLPRQEKIHPLAQLVHDHANLCHELLHLRYTDKEVTEFIATYQHRLSPAYMQLVQFLEDGRIDRIGRARVPEYTNLRQAAATILWQGNADYSLKDYTAFQQVMQSVSSHIYPRPKQVDLPITQANLTSELSPLVQKAVASESSWDTLFWAHAIHQRLKEANLAGDHGLNLNMVQTIREKHRGANMQYLTSPGKPMIMNDLHVFCQGLSEQMASCVY